MSTISIAIGRGGLGLHSALMQYATDYVGQVHSLSKSTDQKPKNEEGYASAFERLYFKENMKEDDHVMRPRSVVLGTMTNCLESFDRTALNRRIRNGMINENGIRSKASEEIPPKKWEYDKDFIFQVPDASYDIWSRGFSTAAGQGDEIIDVIRKCVEGTDSLNGFVSLGSLGGGTGSGMGAYVAKLISDQYPKAAHISTAIMPFTYGENGTQSLNTILALSHYQEYCDGVTILQNDDQMALCERLFGADSNSMNAFNEMCAFNLFHALRPPSSTCPISGNVRFHKPLNFITDGLCSYPSLKLLNLHLVPLEPLSAAAQNHISVNQMVNQLADTLKRDPTLGDRLNNETVSLTVKELTQDTAKPTKERSSHGPKDLVVIQDFSTYERTAIKSSESLNRFRDVGHLPIKSPDLKNIKVTEDGLFPTDASKTEVKNTTSTTFKLIRTTGKKRTNVTKYNVVAGIQLNIGGPLKENLNLVEIYQDVLFWKYSTRPVQVTYCPKDVGLFGNTMSQISNSQAILPSLDFVHTTSKMLYATNAYIHKYTEYGLEREDIQSGIGNVQEIIQSYKSLSTA